jgi:NTP pyrophosphatase (non-canonical NTP hydrolase)
MKDYFELEACIEDWAKEKGIMDNANPIKQAMKTQEEVTELCNAILDNDVHEIKDAIGDIIVTLIIQAKMQGTTVEECLNAAYSVIKKRTGSMVNGTFVKDEEFKGHLITKDTWDSADKITHDGFIYVKYTDLVTRK